MKIIDLLINMEKNEDIPKKIKYKDEIYEYEVEYKDYYNEYYSLFENEFDGECYKYLSEKIEIVEDKKINKLDITELRKREECNVLFMEIMAKINEIIEVINEK